MKKKILLACIFLLPPALLPLPLFAQSPQGINYQAVARDASGNPIVSQTISVQFDIHRGSATGPVSMSETHANISTNPFGLFSLEIGAVNITGFDTIAWGKNKYWLEVLIDPSPPSSFVSMGATQFLSVPYSFHSTTADSLTSIPSGSLPWKRNADSVFLRFNTDRVGIGTKSPSGKLSVLVSSLTDSVDGFNVAHQGTGHAGVFAQNNPLNDSATLVSYTNGKGIAVFGINMGTGKNAHGGVFSVNNSSSSGCGLIGSSTGNGKAVFGYQTGSGYGGAFWIDIINNDSTALTGMTNGKGDAVWGLTSGTGSAGKFIITNSSSASPALLVAGGQGITLRDRTNVIDAIHLASGTGASASGSIELLNSGIPKVSLSGIGINYFNAGNVGIGTATPSSRLTIQSLVGNEIEFPSNGTNIDIFATGSPGQFRIGGGTSFEVNVNNGTRLLVNSAGNVGIGTISPKSTLKVEGSMAGKFVNPQINASITYTCTPGDYFVFVTMGSSVILPVASSVDAGSVIIVRNNSTASITVMRQGTVDNLYLLNSTSSTLTNVTLVSPGMLGPAVRRFVSDGIDSWIEW